MSIRRLAIEVLALVALALPTALVAQDGTPDPTFAGGVAKRWGYPGTSEPYVVPGGIAVDAQGRYLVVGSRAASFRAPAGTLEIARLRSDGEFDATFGVGGRRVYPAWRNGRHVVTDVKLDHGGRIVIAGTLDRRAMVARLLPDGSFDASFGDAGVVVGGFGSTAFDDNRVQRIAIADDDSVIAAGSFLGLNRSGSPGPYRLPFVWKLTPDGAADATFAGGGIWHPAIDIDNAGSLADVVADGTGGWIAVGKLRGGRAELSANAIRLDATGRPDRSFGSADTVLRDAWEAQFTAVARTHDGGFRVAARLVGFKSIDIFIVGIDRSGTAERSYGNGGNARIHPRTLLLDDAPQASLLVQPDGTLLGGGAISQTYFGSEFGPVAGIHRLLPSGAPDGGYANFGEALVPFGDTPEDSPNQWAGFVTSPGRVVAFGALHRGTHAEFSVVALRDRILLASGFD